MADDGSQGRDRREAVDRALSAREPLALQDIVVLIRRLERDYRGVRSLFRGILERFGYREEELEKLRLGLVQSGILAPDSPDQAKGEGDRHFASVRLLGPFELVIDGSPIEDWPSGKPKVLFKYIVANRRARIAREQLMETFWPERTPDAAANSLRVAVHSLRQVLRPRGNGAKKDEYLLFEDNSYGLSPNLECWVDAEEFERRWNHGRRLATQTPDEAVEEFEAAEGLYRGAFLEEDPYEEWTILRRERLRDIQLGILTRLRDHSLSVGDIDGSIARCQRILEGDPCREDAYQVLMQCYLQLGQPGRAQRWFDICTQVLRQELDLEPSDKTMSLRAQIFAGDLRHD